MASFSFKYFALPIFLFLIITPLCAVVSTDNPYELILESEYEERFQKEVEPHWNNIGKQGSFKGVDGIKLAYITFVLDSDIGAIVISSGRTESYLKYKELVFDLNQQGYSVYIHDHRGQGFSDRMLEDDSHKGHVVDFKHYVTDLNTFVTNVVLPNKHHKMFLLGHSMGGGIATMYIETYPTIFDAVALSSPMHAPDARILVSPEGGCLWFRFMDWMCNECYAGFKSKSYAPEAFSENEYTHSEVRYAKLVEIYKDVKNIQLGGPTRSWAGQACAASTKILKNTDNIQVPVLVLQAGADTAVTPEGQNEFCKNLERDTGTPCFGGEPKRIDGAYHELFIESDEYRIPAVNAILDFFRTQTDLSSEE